MPMTLWVAGTAIIVAVLLIALFRRFSADRLAGFNERRRGSSHIVGRGELVDGNRHMHVALALTDSAFIYENPDIEAFLERKWIQEVEYENELSTGQAVGDGKVLRLRCFSRTFEFVIPRDAVGQWQTALPAQHHFGSV